LDFGELFWGWDLRTGFTTWNEIVVRGCRNRRIFNFSFRACFHTNISNFAGSKLYFI